MIERVSTRCLPIKSPHHLPPRWTTRCKSTRKRLRLGRPLPSPSHPRRRATRSRTRPPRTLDHSKSCATRPLVLVRFASLECCEELTVDASGRAHSRLVVAARVPILVRVERGRPASPRWGRALCTCSTFEWTRQWARPEPASRLALVLPWVSPLPFLCLEPVGSLVGKYASSWRQWS